MTWMIQNLFKEWLLNIGKEIEKCNIFLLIDSCATHNSICQTYFTKLNIIIATSRSWNYPSFLGSLSTVFDEADSSGS